MKAQIFKAKRRYLIFMLILLSISCNDTGQPKQAGDAADDAPGIAADDAPGAATAVHPALPDIIGTSWNLLKIYSRGEESKGDLFVYPEYLFCKSGRWEAHTDSNGMGQMGTYTVEGDKLILVHDGSDQLTASYTMTWNEAGKYLELDDGKLIFRLRFKIKAGC